MEARRADDGLVFEPTGGRMQLGALEVSLPPGAGNREVLEAFVDLVALCRGTRPTSSLEVRRDDLAGLSAALDLDASDLRVLIEEVLLSSTDQAVGLLIQLLQQRLSEGAARADAARGATEASVGGRIVPVGSPVGR